MTDGDGSRTALDDLNLEHAVLLKLAASAKQLVYAQMKETRIHYVCELNTLHNLFKTHKSELFQEHDDRFLAREQIRTERDKKSSRFNGVLSSARRMLFDSTSGERRLEKVVAKLQSLYEDSWKVPASGETSSQVAENSPRVRKLKSQVAGKKSVVRPRLLLLTRTSESWKRRKFGTQS